MLCEVEKRPLPFDGDARRRASPLVTGDVASARWLAWLLRAKLTLGSRALMIGAPNLDLLSLKGSAGGCP